MLGEVRRGMAWGLGVPEESFSLSEMRVRDLRRHGATLFLDVLTDVMEFQQAQSGSDWAEHTVYATEALFTMKRAFLSQETQVVHHASIIEYQLECYDREATVRKVVEKLSGF